jgi:hypothetical protein
MKYLYVIAFFLSITSFSFCQETKSANFPTDYLGVYKGDLKIVNSAETETIPMEFHLKATDSIDKYEYILVYGEGEKRQERLYHLIEKDAAKGNYVIDENNGILLDAKVVDNTLYSMFEVQGSLLTTTERFYEEYMVFEITVSNTQQKQITGNNGEDIPEVIAYPITVVQKARLVKQ